jgi:alpha-mannosidase
MGKPVVHMIGNAHIDPVWLWRLQEGREEVLVTYRSAIERMQESGGFVFTSGGAVTYRWVRQDDPELFAAIQQRVAEGRWSLVNGWWIQPDCNIPAGESFVRHGLYGQRALQEMFGRRAATGYNVDSFGHAGSLPQILLGCGLTNYVFFRPQPGREKDLP